MNGNVVFVWDNTEFDKAALTVDPAAAEDPNFPVKNLQNTIRKKVFKSTSAQATIKIDFGTDDQGEDNKVYARALGIVYHNLHPEGTIAVRAYSDEYNTVTFEKQFDAWESLELFGDDWFGSGVFGGYPDEKDIALYPNIIKIAFWDTENDEDIYQRYWSVTIDNYDTPFYIGKLFLCDYWQPTYNFAFGWDLSLVDPSKTDKSLGGVKWTDIQEQYYVVEFSLEHMQKGEAFGEFIKIVKQIGTRKDAILCLFPDDIDRKFFTTIYGRFTKVPTSRHENLVQYKTTIEFEESL